MKKWIPYIVAAVLGICVAGLMFLPDTSTAPKPGVGSQEPRKPTVQTENGVTTIHGGTTDEPSDAERIAAERAQGIVPPPPGTLRPLNSGEIAHQARDARPFNQHYHLVAAYWGVMARLVAPTDAAVAKECAAMDLYLRDQSKLGDDDLNVTDAINNELALEKKIRTLGIQDDTLTSYLDYINNSANTTLQGGDPTAIVKPGKG